LKNNKLSTTKYKSIIKKTKKPYKPNLKSTDESNELIHHSNESTFNSNQENLPNNVIIKTALVCIAKNEDNYIEEWINYNLKLGFDTVFVYQNDWRCFVNNDRLIKIDFDGDNRQAAAYNHFIHNFGNEYDWAAFFDVDEFLVLKKHNDVKEFVRDYNNYPSLCVNWHFFGNNGHKKVNGDYSVLRRFTKRGLSTDHHIKSMVNLNKIDKLNNIFISVHHISNTIMVDTNFKVLEAAPFNPNGDNNIAQLNHYFVKTQDEWVLKINRGRADVVKAEHHIHKYGQMFFDSRNQNEIEDRLALDFYLS
jgi:hypothetical protein